jgi:hypothetical protein
MRKGPGMGSGASARLAVCAPSRLLSVVGLVVVALLQPPLLPGRQSLRGRLARGVVVALLDLLFLSRAHLLPVCLAGLVVVTLSRVLRLRRRREREQKKRSQGQFRGDSHLKLSLVCLTFCGPQRCGCIRNAGIDRPVACQEAFDRSALLI